MVFKVLLAVFVLLSRGMLSSGQSVSVADTYMVKDETGRVTCQINPPGSTIVNVAWERRRVGEATSTHIYVYWPGGPTKIPHDDLVGRSDYEHFSNGSSTLIIHTVRETDQANYNCRADFGGVIPFDRGQVFVVRRLTAPTVQVTKTPVTEGQRAEFTCTPAESGETILQYEFRRTDGQMSGNVNQEQGRLTIDPTNRSDHGDYSCQVSNVAGPSPWSSDGKLEVDYPPDNVSISGYLNGTTLYSDDDITLTCTAAGGRPHAVSVRWNCLNEGGGDGTEIPGGRQNSFTTKVKKSWHGQLCSCSAWQRMNQGPYTASVTFTVSWPPGRPSLEFTLIFPWLENRTFSATCRSTDVGNPACAYTWSKDNQNLQEPPGAATISLSITKNDHNKEIKCKVENQHTLNRPPQQPLEAKQNLNVQFAPSVRLTPNQDVITKKEDEHLTLECSSESNPVAQHQHYKWTHQKGGSTARERQGQKTWVLGPVKKETAGTYMCEVSVPITHPESTKLRGSRQTSLVVYYLHINSPNASQEVTEYESVTLTCTADNVPAENVQFMPWIHSNRGVDTPLNSNFSNQSIAALQFTSIQYYNTGNYTCKARNDQYPEKMAATQVTVRYTAKQPDHPAEGRIVFTGVGQVVSLSISVDVYPTNVQFNWYYVQGENITSVQEDDHTTINSQHLQSMVNISNITVTDLGNYTVHAENGVRSGSNFTFFVILKDGPGPPFIDVGRSFATPVSTEIWWRSNYDGGYPQTFSVHYRQVAQDYMVFRSGIKDHGLDIPHRIRITPLTPGTAYEFKVEAHNEHNGGSTATSNIVQISTPETGICKMPEGKSSTEIHSPDKTYELLNRPAEYENVKMSTSDEDKTYQDLQKTTLYENVERKNTLQEQTYEELSRPTDAAINPQARGSMDKTYQELQKTTHYENVKRKNTLQEQTYEELSRPTNAAINPQARGSMDEQGATYEELQYKT